MRIGVIILAAGGSSRMGSAKQLLQIGGKSLLRRAVETAVAWKCAPVVVVLGCDAERMVQELGELPVRCVVNEGWQEGMGTSLRVGVENMEGEKIDAAVVMLCDQPRVGLGELTKLLEGYRNGGRAIAAAKYRGTLGAPAIFGREFFAELKKIEADSGAKKILMQHADRVTGVEMEEAGEDVDTPGDYQRLV